MSSPVYFDEETKAQWRYAFDQARSDRDRYLNWIKAEISIAASLIDRYDKIYLLGGLGARLIQATPNFHNEFLENYEGPDKEHVENEKRIDDDEIEVLLEYAISMASASPNVNVGVIPTMENIDEVRNQLSKIKINIGFYEMSAENPSEGTEFDHWLKLRVMEEALHVRGEGYHSHFAEIYKETFMPHDGFLGQYFGFDSKDIFDTIEKLNLLVASKIGNPFGGSLSNKRFTDWGNEKGENYVFEQMRTTGKFFIELFTDDNPDLKHPDSPESIGLIPLDNISAYNRFFWVIPKTDVEKKIFHLLSHSFGDNAAFSQGKFGGFPLGDTIIGTKPLIKSENKYYCFSVNLPFRNLFNITASLLQSADSVYYEQKFRNNASPTSRDNYIEQKAMLLFEKFLPHVKLYHSLDYNIDENGVPKKPELDILGVGKDALYIIEVKAGELNKKHRRGALLGLKQRLRETVDEGSYQCYRAEQFIINNLTPEFSYVEDNKRKTLAIDKTVDYKIYKISVTYEHLSTVSVNLKYLVESGVLSDSYKWTWIVSLFDLMIFADLIESEEDFKEYMNYRLALYERKDVEFNDEIDILGFFFNNGFPLREERDNETIFMVNYMDDIDAYYTKKDVGFPRAPKPTRKRS